MALQPEADVGSFCTFLGNLHLEIVLVRITNGAKR